MSLKCIPVLSILLLLFLVHSSDSQPTGCKQFINAIWLSVLRRGGSIFWSYTCICAFVTRLPWSTSRFSIFFHCDPWTGVVFGANKYYYSKDNFEDQLTNSRAEARCVQLSAHLTSVESKAENLFLFNLNPSLKGIRWIGAVRNRTSTSIRPYSWSWTDGKPFNIFSEYAGCRPDVDCLWQTGANSSNPEPNDILQKESCIQMGHNLAVNSGAWNDAECNVARHFICKRPGKIFIDYYCSQIE
jgi:hypothetical protein